VLIQPASDLLLRDTATAAPPSTIEAEMDTFKILMGDCGLQRTLARKSLEKRIILRHSRRTTWLNRRPVGRRPCWMPLIRSAASILLMDQLTALG
jgi:hypothetical protein